MGWKQWSAVAVVIGGGILLQIPGHDETGMDHGAMEHGETPAGMTDVQGTFRTVVLDVTGMT
jgi:hypothetical protein